MIEVCQIIESEFVQGNLYSAYNDYMESNKIWKLTLIDPGDGSGDALVELPDELLTTIGWVEGELLEIEQVGKCIIIKNLAPNRCA